MLIKSNDTHNHKVIFNRVRITAEIWFGRRTQEAAPRNWVWTVRWRSAKSTSSIRIAERAGCAFYTRGEHSSMR